jgi:magnesium-transporting ATPase (P-type)
MSLFNCEVTVLGPGHDRRTIWSDDLVPGSVIQLTVKDNIIMPCDAVILSGSCVVRESGTKNPKNLIFMKSDRKKIAVAAKPKHKYQLPKSRTKVYNPQSHRQHTLLRGSSFVLHTEKVNCVL